MLDTDFDRLRIKLDLQQPNASDWIQTYGYDFAARMYATASPAGTFGYTYNSGVGGITSASGLIQKIALPNGAAITNAYDGNARMTVTALVNSGGTNLDSSVYTYNVGNQRTAVACGGENTANYTYDAIGQVVGDVAAEGTTNRLNEQLHYGYDPVGNLNYRTNNALIENFQVNSLNELTANTNGGTLTVVGTTTSQATNVTVNVTNTASNYNDATFAAPNMPLTTTYTAVASDSYGRRATNAVTVNIATNTTFQYDGNGNLTNDGLRSFAYDDENQLIQVSVSNQWLSQFAYDGKMRRRIRQECAWQGGAWVRTNQVYYVYDGNEVIQERDVNNLPTTTYTRGKDLSGSLKGAGGIGGLLSMTLNVEPGPLNSNSMYYHSDGNGNVTMLINGSQAIVAKYLYDAFGNILSAAGSLAQANLYRFSSKETHPNSGLIYYLYRYYDPNLQRWPNRDPIQEAGGINLYAFVRNNPINQIDPLGLAWYDGLAALAGLGGPGTFSGAWGAFGDSWSSSSQSMWNAVKASNQNELADAYNGGIFDQTQSADAFTYYGTRAAVGTAAAATAAAVAIDAAGLSTRIACHGSHHEFGPMGRLPHVQINWWQAGVNGSGGALRIPVPPGTPGFPP